MNVSPAISSHPVRFAVLAAFLGVTVFGPGIHRLLHHHGHDCSDASASSTELPAGSVVAVVTTGHAHTTCSHHGCHASHEAPDPTQTEPHHNDYPGNDHEHDECPVCQAISLHLTLIASVSQCEATAAVPECLVSSRRDVLPSVTRSQSSARGPPCEIALG